MTFPAGLKASDYPAYMAGPMYFQAQRSVRVLTESGPLTLEKMIELKHSTWMVWRIAW